MRTLLVLRYFTILALCSIPAANVSAQEADTKALAIQARQILKSHCYRCHNGEGSDSGSDFDVLKLATMLKPREGKPMLTPKDVNKSYLWDRVIDGSMPRKKNPERDTWTDAKKDVIRKWIDAGAPDFPADEARPFIPLLTTLRAIQTDLLSLDVNDRAFTRYFTLTTLHNDPKYSADQIRLTRAALSKAINSLSWEARIIIPRELPETSGTVYAVDIRKLGWTAAHWRAILHEYPYGLGYDTHDDANLRKTQEGIENLAKLDGELNYIRADWFVAVGTQPKLYHRVLYELTLPELKKREDDPKRPDNPRHMTAQDLERHLRVDVEENLRLSEPRAQRAGFAKSGVSGHNRMIERHPMQGGAYWKSYDFKASVWEANLQQFPLGPEFDRNPFPQLAFKHAGGELIFNLPNGLQAYLLVKEDGDRIDAGPIDIVGDALKTSGTSAIVNGVSCMACHKHGMLENFTDQIRTGTGLRGKPLERVELLYPKDDEFKKLVRKDAKIFMAALDEAISPFLKVGPDQQRPLEDFPEPVGDITRKYLEDIDLATVTAELSFADPAKLKQRIAESDDLKRIGLGALTKDGGLLKRGSWEAIRGRSQMQQAASKLFGYTSYRLLD